MSRESIIEKFEKYKGQFVINASWQVQRLIAVSEDDMDWYWVFYDGRKVNLCSCVMGFVPLKGFVEEKHYQEFIRLAKLNDYDRPEIFKEDIEEAKKFNDAAKAEIENYLKEPHDRYVTPICWDLN